MSVFDNMFVKKAIKSMVTSEQFNMIQNFMKAIESGEIDNAKLKMASDKVSKMKPKDINNILDLINGME